MPVTAPERPGSASHRGPGRSPWLFLPLSSGIVPPFNLGPIGRVGVPLAALFLLLLLASPSLWAAEPWLSSLASPPEWRLLDRYQKSITRLEFEDLLRQVYSLDGDFLRYMDLTDEKAVIWREPEKITQVWILEFAPAPEATRNRPSLFFPTDTSDLRNATPEKPLKGLRILLDPGHIGGDWARMEQRDMPIAKNPPIREAALNLFACRRLAQLLEGAGAEVLWTKTTLEPVTPLRPSDLHAEALGLIMSRNPQASQMRKADLLQAVKSRTEMLFYRVSEIQARAALAERLKPDLTLCVHFNAAADPHPGKPGLFDSNRLVIFVNGSYLPDELPFDDIKFNLLKKILERSHSVETAVAADIGNSMAKNWPIPPETYTGWPAANRISDSPYVWSRNLIANRLFPGPVVFVEGPYMNDRMTYSRLLAGDYEGTRIIDGKAQPSIFLEFAKIIYEGVLTYYTTPPPEPPAPPTPPPSSGSIPALPPSP